MNTVTQDIATVGIDRLHEVLGVRDACVLPDESRDKRLVDWSMFPDDAHILRYIYRHLRPRRHLEFGTWEGFGALLCLENCDATVWTINLREGERNDSGEWRYYTDIPDSERSPVWSNTRETRGNPPVAPDTGLNTSQTRSGKTLYQTDARGFIGRRVHERGLGHRLCQVYCDSRDWDATAYPGDFFDTVLIDGGHTPEVVVSDTRKALSVLKPGGVVIWHDFCPHPEVIEKCESVRGVIGGIDTLRDELHHDCRALFWVDPSWMLIGIKRDDPGGPGGDR